jgi:hypothetical protein
MEPDTRCRSWCVVSIEGESGAPGGLSDLPHSGTPNAPTSHMESWSSVTATVCRSQDSPIVAHRRAGVGVSKRHAMETVCGAAVLRHPRRPPSLVRKMVP